MMIIDGIIAVVALLSIAAVFAGITKCLEVCDTNSYIGLFTGASAMIFGIALIVGIGAGSLTLIGYRHDIKHAERIEIIDGR
jgi:hypothetical protein